MHRQYRAPALLWLFVPAYLCHLAEEFFAGFPEWFAIVVARPLPRTGFLLINAVALVVMVAAIRAATRRETDEWMAIAVATVLFVNAIAHLAGCLVVGAYAPGVLTGVVIYVPLTMLVLIRAWHQARPETFTRGVVAGFLVHALVFVLAFALTRV